MDLGLDIDVRTVGRAAKRPPLAEQLRELTVPDLALLDVERGIKPPALIRIRESHHAVARALAEGLTNAEVSIRTGYSASRISILKRDPAFVELTEAYAMGVKAEFELAQTLARGVTMTALQEIQERLEDDSDQEISLGQLTDIIDTTAKVAGLTGQPNKTTVTLMSESMTVKLNRARERAGLVIDAVALPSPSQTEESVP